MNTRTRIGVVLALLLALVGIGLSGATTASAAGSGDTLGYGATLNPGDAIVSPNGYYTARMQNDGNFVVYQPWQSATWATAWFNQTYRGGSRLVMQTDGNLVLYPAGVGPNYGATWASNTSGRGPGPTRLVMQDDGNLVIYNAFNQATWASNTYDPYHAYDSNYKGVPAHMNVPYPGDARNAQSGRASCYAGTANGAQIWIYPGVPGDVLLHVLDHEWGHVRECATNIAVSDENVADCIAELLGHGLPPGYYSSPGYGCNTADQRNKAQQILNRS